MSSKICWETNFPENLQVPRPYLKYRLTNKVLPGSASLTKTAVCLPVYHVVAEPCDFKLIYNHTCGAAVSILITSTASLRRNQPGLYYGLTFPMHISVERLLFVDTLLVLCLQTLDNQTAGFFFPHDVWLGTVSVALNLVKLNIVFAKKNTNCLWQAGGASLWNKIAATFMMC